MSPTKIEWTRGDDGTPGETWNPTVGCSKVSPGCDNCYAIRVASRGLQEAHRGLTFETDDYRPSARPHELLKGHDWGEVRCLPERLDTPLHWRKPRRVFVDSMSDLFHPSVPDDFIARVWAVMALAYRHTFQVLTKRPRRMAELLSSRWENDGIRSFESLVEHYVGDHASEYVVEWPLPNVIGMTSVEDQRQADRRIPHLIATPLALRGLSAEPLLGPIDLEGHIETMSPEDAALPNPIDWVIVGGESGPGARPMHPDWARGLRDQCVAASVPFFFKQWGGRTPKAGGRILDGRTWDEWPGCTGEETR